MQPGELSLELARAFEVPRPRLYEFLVDPAELARWWGPRGFSIPSIDFAPRVGASYRIEMQPPEGDAFHLAGRFTEVDPPSRLAFSFNWEPADPDDVETVAELSLRALNGSTEVVLTQGLFATEARRELHRQGWNESLEKLDELASQDP